MNIIEANMKIPILKAILPLEKDYQEKCINRIYEIGDEMENSTNLQAIMSSYHAFKKEKIFYPLIKKISNFIQDNYKSEPLWKNDPRDYILKIIDCWSGIYKKDHWAYPHNHTPAMISFCYYLQCDEYSQGLYFNELDLTIKPENNLLVVFPAPVYHCVDKQSGEGIDRIVIAGNYIAAAEKEKKYNESFFK